MSEASVHRFCIKYRIIEFKISYTHYWCFKIKPFQELYIYLKQTFNSKLQNAINGSDCF